MITFHYSRNPLCLQTQGHARSGEKGNDLICAGVSTLMYTLAQTVRQLTEEGLAEGSLVELEPGRGLVSCHAREGSPAEAVFNGIYTGLKTLAAHYPQYVQEELTE